MTLCGPGSNPGPIEEISAQSVKSKWGLWSSYTISMLISWFWWCVLGRWRSVTVKKNVHHDQYHHQHCLALQPVEIRMANLDVILSSVTFKQSTVKRLRKHRIMCWQWKWEFTEHSERNARMGSKGSESQRQRKYKAFKYGIRALKKADIQLVLEWG